MYQTFIFDGYAVSNKVVSSYESDFLGPIKLDFYPYELVSKSLVLLVQNKCFSENKVLELDILIVDEERNTPFLLNMSSSYALVLLSEIIFRLKDCCLKLNWDILEVKKHKRELLKITLRTNSISCYENFISQFLIFKEILEYLLSSRGLMLTSVDLKSDFLDSNINSLIVKILNQRC